MTHPHCHPSRDHNVRFRPVPPVSAWGGVSTVNFCQVPIPGGKPLATASPFDAALSDVLDRLHSASSDLEGARDATEVAQRAAEAVLALTRSAQAVVALGGVSHELERYDRYFARGADGARPPTEDEVAELLAAAGLLPH